MLVLHAKGPEVESLSLQELFFENFLFFRISAVSNPGQNCKLSTFFNPLPVALRDPLGVFRTPLGSQGAAESGGTWSKFDLELLLLSKKIEKLQFFKILTFKFKNLLV